MIVRLILSAIIILTGNFSEPAVAGQKATRDCGTTAKLVHDNRLLATGYRHTLSGQCKFTANFPPKMAEADLENPTVQFALFFLKLKESNSDVVSSMIEKDGTRLLGEALQSIVDDSSEDGKTLSSLVGGGDLAPVFFQCLDSVLGGKEFRSQELLQIECKPDGERGLQVMAAYNAAEASIFLPSAA